MNEKSNDGCLKMERIGAGWIVEDTEEKAIQEAEKLLKAGKISGYGEVKKGCKGYGRRTRNPLLTYKIHCYK